MATNGGGVLPNCQNWLITCLQVIQLSSWMAHSSMLKCYKGSQVPKYRISTMVQAVELVVMVWGTYFVFGYLDP